jgi:predicted GIY-YIG superfamily endonuclease
VTSRLEARIASHRRKIIGGFTKKYNLTRLAYYESFGDMRAASVREKQIKSWLRANKSRRSGLLILSGKTFWKTSIRTWKTALTAVRRLSPRSRQTVILSGVAGHAVEPSLFGFRLNSASPIIRRPNSFSLHNLALAL